MGQDTLPDISQEHDDAVVCGYERGARLSDRPSFRYGCDHLWELKAIKMYKQGSSTETETYRKDHCVLITARTDDTQHGVLKGDARARNVAKITGIYENDAGHCYVSLHYFWRWGQIHAEYDLHPATSLQCKYQVFLQKELLQSEARVAGEMLRTPVRYPSGKPVELLSAVHLECIIFVRHRAVAERYTDGGGGLAGYIQDYGKENWDVETNTPNSGFWFDSTFDQSCQRFEQCDENELPVPVTWQIPAGKLTILDAFCGCGAVSIAANTLGFTVIAGIDTNADAISSFARNTMSTSGGSFNPHTQVQPRALHMTVQDAINKIRSEQLQLPRVHVLHASPPCQNVSNKQKIQNRVITGSEALAVVELVKLLQPAYVTLEEVAGFVVQKFYKRNMLGPLAGWPYDAAAAALPGAASPLAAGSSQELDVGDDDVGAENEDQQLSEGAGYAATSETVVFSMLTVVVSKLLGMGYTVELGFLQASDFQVPQSRWRVFMVATKSGYEPARLPTPRCERLSTTVPPGLVVDPNLCLESFADPHERKPDSWFKMQVGPEEICDTCYLPTVTVAEAIGDLPPLLAQQPESATTRLGVPLLLLSREDYDFGGVCRCPLPVQRTGGYEPYSQYSVYMQAPHAEHQRLRLQHVVPAEGQVAIRDHIVEFSTKAMLKLLSEPEGRRPAADGLVTTVMGHNEPAKRCTHFLEDRLHSLRERCRLQSLPDWVQYEGDYKSRQQQVGNAVPYLVSLAVLGQVYAAATGQQAYKPPNLQGPSWGGVGIPAAASADDAWAAFQRWVQQVDEAEQQQSGKGYRHAIQDCAKLLSEKAAAVELQHAQWLPQLRQQAANLRVNQLQQSSAAQQQQPGNMQPQQWTRSGGGDAAAGPSQPHPGASSSHLQGSLQQLASAAAAPGPSTGKQALVSSQSQRSWQKQQQRQSQGAGPSARLAVSGSSQQQQQRGQGHNQPRTGPAAAADEQQRGGTCAKRSREVQQGSEQEQQQQGPQKQACSSSQQAKLQLQAAFAGS